MKVATSEFPRTVVHGFMSCELRAKALVGCEFVRDNAGLPVHFLTQHCFERAASNVGYDAAAQLALPLDGNEYGGFVFGAASTFEHAAIAGPPRAHVHFSAFHGSSQFRAVRVWSHRKPNPIHKKQSGFITDLALPLDLQG
jgi:hypothetical protein